MVMELMRRFVLNRMSDVSGISGTGYVACGVCFSDGLCVMRWTTETSSTVVYDSVVDLMEVHGHGGATVLIWLD